ncbi:ABC transporter substrate-binding protein [Roseomonas chloroacetimidivorans]|uniref:ABC transporter substrate-binding protein n=1 Tax=Roseomonas chloroacetimidivorans TaxID=1766656 RepID=UPI003C74D5C3
MRRRGLIAISAGLGFAPAIRAGAAEPVRVGALYPLSGQVAKSGEDTLNAIRLAVDIVNTPQDNIDLPLAKSDGLPNLGGAKIEIIAADHQGSPEVGQAEAARLIEQRGVQALIGAFHSSVAGTSSQVAERMGIPYISGESEDTSLTQRGFRWFFRTTPSSDTQTRDFFTFLSEVRDRGGPGIQRMAVVHENTLWGEGFRDSVKRMIGERPGFRIISDITYQQGSPDVTSEVQQLIAARPDAVLHASYDAEAILFARTYKQYNLRTQGIMALGAAFGSSAFRNALGADANFFLVRDHWARDLAGSKPVVAQVGAMYRDRFGKDLDGTPARAFTAMMTLADAINRAGSTDPEKIRQALIATDLREADTIMPWEGVRFDSTGQNVLTRGIFTQTLDRVPKTVWPFNLAAGTLVWPRPAWR